MAEANCSFDDELVRLFDLSHDAFCIAGFDGYLKRANPAFPRLLGYTTEELLARPFIDNIHPDDREPVEAVLAELAAGKPVVGFECRHICADGSLRWFEWSTSSRPQAGVMYVPRVSVARYELDGTATTCAIFPPLDRVSSVGQQWSLAGTSVLARVR